MSFFVQVFSTLTAADFLKIGSEVTFSFKNPYTVKVSLPASQSSSLVMGSGSLNVWT